MSITAKKKQKNKRKADSSKPVVLECVNVTKRVGIGKAKRELLSKVNLAVREGEFVSIVGPSGAGKTVLIQCIMGLVDSDGGEIYLNERQIDELGSNAKTEIRRRNFGYLGEDSTLLEYLSVRENIALPLLGNGLPKGEVETAVSNVLKKLFIEHLADKRVDELTLKEYHVVCLARALATRPMVVLLDEPTRKLNTEESREFMKLLAMLNQEDGLTILVTTHNPEVGVVAGKTLRMDSGRIL